RLGHEGSLAYQSWPTYDESLCAADTIEIPVQINGKIRERLYVAPDISKEALLALAKEAAASRLEGKQIVKEIVVPGRLVNLVVKG
ncbi:MAG TPA: leucine--tRNA ligase, partial [bacterium]|nr:leucine--tRNA ligase [bacterium]